MRPRIIFFSLFAAMSMPGRFLPLFYTSHAQSPSQVGALIAVATLVAVFANPILCNLADRTRRRERVAAVTYALATLVFQLQLVAWPSQHALSPPNAFTVLLLIRIVFGFCKAPAYPLVSAVAIDRLTTEFGNDGHHHFGEERLWGAVSWALCALGLGAVLDWLPVDMRAVYVGVAVFGTAHVIALLVFEAQKKLVEERVASNGEADGEPCVLLSEGAENPEAPDAAAPVPAPAPARPTVSMSALPTIYRILTAGGLPTVLYFNMFFCLSFAMSLVENLLFLFFQLDLHASNFVCGLSVVVTVVFEIPLFAMAPRLLRRLGSPALALIACLAYAIRAYGYTVVPNGWYALFFEPLHGVTYAAIETATVAFVAERTPKELEATGQAVVAALRTLSYTVGTAVGGWVIQHFGSRVLYRGAGVMVLIAASAFAIAYWLSGHPVEIEKGRKGVEDGSRMDKEPLLEVEEEGTAREVDLVET